jgi:serine/threonine protein kinase
MSRKRQARSYEEETELESTLEVPDIINVWKRARIEYQQDKEEHKHVREVDIIQQSIVDIFLNNPKYQLLEEQYIPAKRIHSKSNNNNRDPRSKWYIPLKKAFLGKGVYGSTYKIYDSSKDDNKAEEFSCVAKVIHKRETLAQMLLVGDRFFQSSVLQEITLQQRAAEVGVALPIYDAWFIKAEDDRKILPPLLTAQSNNLITTAVFIMKRADLTIKEMIKDKDLTKKQLSAIRHEVALLIDDLHKKAHIMHKDIHYGNVMFRKDEDQFYIIDFGLARELKRGEPLHSRDFLVLNTLADYIRNARGSPETQSDTIPYEDDESSGLSQYEEEEEEEEQKHYVSNFDTAFKWDPDTGNLVMEDGREFVPPVLEMVPEEEEEQSKEVGFYDVPSGPDNPFDPEETRRIRKQYKKSPYPHHQQQQEEEVDYEAKYNSPKVHSPIVEQYESATQRR